MLRTHYLLPSDGPLFYKPLATPPSLTKANSGAGEENTLAASLSRALQQQQQDSARSEIIQLIGINFWFKIDHKSFPP